MDQLKAAVADIQRRFGVMETSVLSNVTQLVRDVHLSSTKSKSDRVWDFAVKVSVPLVVMAVVYLFNLANRVSYIEATRFTNLDFQQRIADIEKKLITAAEGPSWLRQEIVSIGVKMDGLKENIARLSERVVRVESEIKK